MQMCICLFIFPSLEFTTYNFRAFIFMARNLIGSDASGLSDAFVRILLNDHVLTSYVINQTLSPCWDCTLEIPEMNFYFSEEYIHENPPVVVVEVYDEDIMVRTLCIFVTSAMEL